MVAEQLQARGHDIFLPKVVGWSRTPRGRERAARALFPGYLFLRAELDRATHADVLEVRGIVRILGERWDRLATIPDDEMTAVRRMVEEGPGPFRYEMPNDGERVRVIRGPLEGLHGRFVRAKPARGLFVVAVDLLQRGVAVEVDATWIARG